MVVQARYIFCLLIDIDCSVICVFIREIIAFAIGSRKIGVQIDSERTSFFHCRFLVVNQVQTARKRIVCSIVNRISPTCRIVISKIRVFSFCIGIAGAVIYIGLQNECLQAINFCFQILLGLK